MPWNCNAPALKVSAETKPSYDDFLPWIGVCVVKGGLFWQLWLLSERWVTAVDLATMWLWVAGMYVSDNSKTQIELYLCGGAITVKQNKDWPPFVSPIVGVTVYNPVSCLCKNSISKSDWPSAPPPESATGRRASTENTTQRIAVLLLEKLQLTYWMGNGVILFDWTYLFQS